MDPKNQQQPDYFSLQVKDARRFYSVLLVEKRTPLVIVSGGCERSLPDYQIERTSFPYYSIEFVAGGKGTVQLARTESALHAGRIFCYGPGIPHKIRTDSVDPLFKYFVNFGGSHASKLLNSQNIPLGVTLQVFSPVEIQAFFEDIIRNGIKGTRYSPAICLKLLECLVLKIAESLMPTSAAETPAFSTYQNCRQHIQNHFLQLKTLDQIASECHVDPAYLCRLFRRYDHQTPYQYLLRLKMNLAAERLQKSDTLVKQVADELGFNDAFHFSRAFKNIFGLAPESFRRMQHGVGETSSPQSPAGPADQE